MHYLWRETSWHRILQTVGTIGATLTVGAAGCGRSQQPVSKGIHTGSSRVLGFSEKSQIFLSQETMGLREWDIQSLTPRSRRFCCDRLDLGLGAVAESPSSWIVVEQTRVVRFNTREQLCHDVIQYSGDSFGSIRAWHWQDGVQLLSIGSETGNAATVEFAKAEAPLVTDWGFPKTDSPIIALRHGVPTEECRVAVTQAGQLIVQTSPRDRPRITELGPFVVAADVWADGKAFCFILLNRKRDGRPGSPAPCQLFVGDTLSGVVRAGIEMSDSPYGMLCSDIALPGQVFLFFHDPARIECLDPQTRRLTTIANVDHSIWTWCEVRGTKNLILGTSARFVVIDVSLALESKPSS